MTDSERLLALEQARRDIEDSLLVMAHLEKKQSDIIRSLSERQELAERQWQLQQQRNAEVDTRIENLVSAIGKLISSPGLQA